MRGPGRSRGLLGVAFVTALMVVPGVSTATASTASAAPETTVLHFVSEPGDYIGGGQTVTLTEEDVDFLPTTSIYPAGSIRFSINNFGRTSTPPYEWWHATFSPPAGEQLAVGSYLGATRWPFQDPLDPGLDFSGNGRGCNHLTGRFVVHEAVYATEGALERFAVDFEQHCEGGDPALYGYLRFRSSVPAPTEVEVTGDLTLDADHYGSIQILADDVTLDCAGHSVTGPGAGVGIDIRGHRGVTIANCDLSGHTTGMSLVNSSGNTLVGNTSHDNTSYGVVVDSHGAPMASDNRLQGNVAMDNGSHGFAVLGGHTENNHLEANEALNNAGNGYYVAGGASGTTLIENTSVSNLRDGYELNRAHANQLIDNMAEGNARIGFLMWEAGSNQLTGNTASASGAEGFFVATNDLARPADANTLLDNVATDNGASGFSFVHSSHNELVGNVAQDNETHGFAVTSWLELDACNNRFEANTAAGNGADGFSLDNAATCPPEATRPATTSFVDNLSQNNDHAGFALRASHDVTVSRNHILQNGQDGVAVWSGSHHTIVDNQIVNNGRGAGGGGLLIADGSHDNTITGNNASSNAHNGFLVAGHGSEHNRLAGNEATTNGHNGFAIWLADHNRMESNTASDNARFGLVVAGSPSGDWATHNTLVGNSASGHDAEDPGALQGAGFHAEFVSNSLFEGNNATSNSTGFRLWKADDDNEFVNNVAHQNVVGFVIANSHRNEFTENTASHNSSRSGFELHAASSGNVFVHNTASNNNSWAGFAVYNGVENEFIENTAVKNKWGFAVLEPSTGNLFQSNFARNAWLDQRDDTQPDANTWVDNDFKWVDGDGGWR